MPRDLVPCEVRNFDEEQQMTAATDQQWDTDQQMDTFLAEAREILVLRENKAKLEARESVLKKSLMAILDQIGQPYGPEGQHKAIEFPTPIRKIARLVRQTKHTVSVDEVKAEALARQKGIYDRLFKMQPVLDQDAVMVAVAEGLISDAEVAEIFPKKTIHAFTVEKVKP